VAASAAREHGSPASHILSLSAPVLFFYGQSDWMVGPMHYKHARIPHMLPWPCAVGHVPFLENQADLARAIASYRKRFHL
jgi:proline iminopeptidase